MRPNILNKHEKIKNDLSIIFPGIGMTIEIICGTGISEVKNG